MEAEAESSGVVYNKDDFFDALSSDLKDKLNTSETNQRPRFSDQRQVGFLLYQAATVGLSSWSTSGADL